MNSRERLLAMFTGEPVDCVPAMPITMMFAADCIGVRYRDYATNYQVLVEAQLAVAEKYGFDYVSCISDPGREAHDLGATIEYYDDQPPAINEAHALLANKADLLTLKIPDPLGGGRMHDRVKAAALFRQRVNKDLLIEGWVEGPCAEAADLRGINTLMMDFFDDPQFVNDLFAFTVQNAIQFAQAQIDAGVDLIGVGDAAASLVGPEFYRDFVAPHEKVLVDAIHEMSGRVRLHICGKTFKSFTEMGRLGCEMIDLDWMNPMDQARREMGPDQVLCGNIDPVKVLKNGTPEGVYAAIEKCHQDSGKNYIAGAGCEVPRGTPDENVEALVTYARTHRPELG
jgi:MtaA/CmuA family methyltransferase